MNKNSILGSDRMIGPFYVYIDIYYKGCSMCCNRSFCGGRKMTIVQIITLSVVAYLSIGVYAARATSVFVNAGMMWSESSLWQRMQRMVLFPIQTLGAFLHPHAMTTPLARLRPSYELLAAKNPTFYCVFMWPLTIICFVLLLLLLIVSWFASFLPYFRN